MQSLMCFVFMICLCFLCVTVIRGVIFELIEGRVMVRIIIDRVCDGL